MLGFSFIQPHSKAFEHFLNVNCEKKYGVTAQKWLLTKKYSELSNSPTQSCWRSVKLATLQILLKSNKSPLSWNSLKCYLQAINECQEIVLKRKSSLCKQTLPPNTFANSRPISACYFIFRSPPMDIFAQYSPHTNPRVPNIQPSYHLVRFLLTVDIVWLILSWWGEPKERKPQANQLGLNWSSQGGQKSEAKWNWAL